MAGLTGNEEVPVVDTNVTGSALFESKLSDTIHTMVNITDMANITSAELSIGKQGENGQIAVVSNESHLYEYKWHFGSRQHQLLC